VFFDGFDRRRLPGADGVTINAVVGGSGPPVLLLHGFPQSHVTWHRVGPALARWFTVVATDLRGYGDSDKPPSDREHRVYSKRATGNDQVAVMRSLGFRRFRLVGWDRGARVAHRIALDHPDAVERIAVLSIAPSREMLARVNVGFALAYYHWFFLAQPYDFPERTILADPENFVLRNLGAASGGPNEGVFAPEALAEYVRCYRDPGVVHATCEDYRAMMSVDLRDDEEDGGRKIAAPLFAMWGDRGVIQQMFDAQSLWRERAENVTADVIAGGHYICEENPETVVTKLLAFLT